MSSDPVIHAEGIVSDPSAGGKHLLVIDGVDDEQVPAVSLQAFARASWLPIAGTVLDDFGLSSIPLPASLNVPTRDGDRTAAIVQLSAGHLPLAESADARDLAVRFIATGVAGTPVIGE